MQGASNALSAWKLPQSVQSPLLKQILPTPKPAPVDPNKSPEVFKKRFIEKHGDGVAEDGRNYSQIPAPEIVAKVIRKYGDGNTTDGIPYREFLPRPASPNDSLEYRLSQIESLSQAPKSQFYAPTWTIRWQTEQEKKFTTAVTKRENEGELVKTLKAPYRGLESVGQNLAYGTFGAWADVVDMFWGDKLADKMRKSVEKEKFQSGMLSQNKWLIWGMQSGDLSSVIETLSSGAWYLATGAKIPLYLTALSQWGNLSQEWEEQWQGTLWDKAIAYTTGWISAAIERMSGQKVIWGMMRAGIKKETATTFVQKMNNYLKWLKPSDFEAGTEVIQQGIENIGRSTMGVDYDKGIQQYFEAGLLGKILGKVGDKWFSESPVTVLPPAPPAPSRVDTKNIETLQTIKIGKRANANVESNKSRWFDPYTDIATHQEILPTVDKTGLVRTTEQVQNLEDTLDPINDALTKSIKDEWVLIPLDEFLIDSMNEAKQYENEWASYDRYVNQIRKDFEVYKRFTDAQWRIDLSKINEIKKAKYGISNFSDVESDKANKMVGKAAKELVEKYTKWESTKAINRELARWYSARDLLLAMDWKTVKGGRLWKMAARVGWNIIGSYFWPLGSFAGWEISAAVQWQMMKGSLKTPKWNIDSGDILSKIPKRTTPQLPPASQSSSDKKVELPKQSQPVSVLGLPSQTQAVVPKKEVSWKKVNAPIIQKLAKKQEIDEARRLYDEPPFTLSEKENALVDKYRSEIATERKEIFKSKILKEYDNSWEKDYNAFIQKKVDKLTQENKEAIEFIENEFDVAEAGRRTFSRSDIQDTISIREPSTFPKWIPEWLRSKKILMETIEYIRDWKLIPTNKWKVRELANIIYNKLSPNLNIYERDSQSLLSKIKSTRKTGWNTKKSNPSMTKQKTDWTSEINTGINLDDIPF